MAALQAEGACIDPDAGLAALRPVLSQSGLDDASSFSADIRLALSGEKNATKASPLDAVSSLLPSLLRPDSALPSHRKLVLVLASVTTILSHLIKHDHAFSAGDLAAWGSRKTPRADDLLRSLQNGQSVVDVLLRDLRNLQDVIKYERSQFRTTLSTLPKETLDQIAFELEVEDETSPYWDGTIDRESLSNLCLVNRKLADVVQPRVHAHLRLQMWRHVQPVPAPKFWNMVRTLECDFWPIEEPSEETSEDLVVVRDDPEALVNALLPNFPKVNRLVIRGATTFDVDLLVSRRL